LTSAEKDREPAQNRGHRRDQLAEHREQDRGLPVLVQAYERADVAVTVEIVGYVRRGGVECPPKYLCLTYQRLAKKRLMTQEGRQTTLLRPYALLLAERASAGVCRCY